MCPRHRAGFSPCLYALQHAAVRQGRGDRLDHLLQSSKAAFDAGLYQPDGLREEMACQPKKIGSIMSELTHLIHEPNFCNG